MRKKELYKLSAVLLVAVLSGIALWKCWAQPEVQNANDMVDAEIAQLVGSSLYISANEVKRRELAQQLLQRLQDEDKISSYESPATGRVLPFAYLDGSLGGINLKEFAQTTRLQEPMN